jgi:hypothetical protein
MKFASTTVHESKSCPGVTFTLRRVGYGLRAQLEFETAESRSQQRALDRTWRDARDQREDDPQYQAASAELLRLAADLPAAIPGVDIPLTAEQRVQVGKINQLPDSRRMVDSTDAFTLIQQRSIDPVWLRSVVVEIRGVETDSPEASAYPVESLIEYGPRELQEDIIEEINQAAYFSTDLSKNSPPPIISSAPADGRASTTGATPASGAATT